MATKHRTKITDAEVKIACYGATYKTLEDRRAVLLQAARERGIEATSVTPFAELAARLHASTQDIPKGGAL
jgi:hypothetical protein